MTRRHALLLASAVTLVASCVTPPRKDYTRFLAANPRSILIVPVVNNSVDVEAPTYFLSTLTIPIAERGYYAFPVNLVKRMLEDDGMADAALVHGADPMRLCNLFGADAVLYVTIQRWDARYVVLSTTVTVEFKYRLVDGKTGDVLWEDQRTMAYQPNNSGGGLIGALVSAAVTRASPNYMPLARQANDTALAWPGPGLPAGPYLPEYRKDLAPAPR